MTFSLPLKWLLTLGGAVGLWASAVLTIDKIKILEDPSYISNCDINSIFSCGEIVNTSQASVFGFPNTLIGIASFSVLITIGIILLSGVPLPRWILGGIVFGSGISTIFVTWLAYQSIFVIGALCAYCIVAWGMTLPIFSLSARDLMRSSSRPSISALSGLMGIFLVAWAAAVFILIYLFLII
jgi:uncharacterized membrane protein